MKNLIESQIKILKEEISKIEVEMSDLYKELQHEGVEQVDISKSTYEIFDNHMREFITKREMKREAIINLLSVLELDRRMN
jgi:uncharacterized small protein (DUF1192 family)